MNKITVKRDENFDLANFIDDNPNGTIETQNYNLSRKPFWGYGDWNCGDCDPSGHKTCYRKYYIFWTCVDYDYDWRSC